MSPTSYQAALPRVIPSLLSATLIIIPYSNGFVKRVRKVFLQRKQRTKTRLLTFFPESQQARQFTPLRERRQSANVSVQVINQFQFTPLREGRRFRARNAPTWSLFQFTPLREGRLILGLYLLADLIFQFTPLREGRQNGFIKIHIFKYFNSRPSARGDRPFQLRHVLHADFNSRPSARGDISEDVPKEAVTFQFTPLREGRHGCAGRCNPFHRISIHAPPRGATDLSTRVPSSYS